MSFKHVVKLGIFASLAIVAVLTGGHGDPASAGTNAWTQVVVGGARIHDLQYSADGSELWAATGGSGVFKSSDGGQTWLHASPTLAATQFLSLAQSPTSSSTWMSATENDVWSTTDGGVTWTSLLTSSDASSLTAVEFHTTSGSTLFTATAASLYKSTNGGSTWSLADSGIEGENLRSVTLSPHNSAHLWVCGSSGPYLSTNTAGSFALKASGLNTIPHPITTVIACHPTSTSKLYLGTWWGLFRSTDTGATWSKISAVPERMVNRIAVVNGSPGVLYAATDEGLFRAYTNDDANWTEVRAGAHYAVAAKSGSVVVADQDGAMFGSSDAGATWSALTSAGAADVTSLAMRGTTAFAVTSDSAGLSQLLYKSTDTGLTWSRVTSLPAGSQPTTVEMDAMNRVYVGSTHLDDIGQSGVFVSTDSGTTWTQTGMAGGPGTFYADFVDVYAIGAHPTTGTVVTSLLPDGRSHSETDVFVSTNAGATWAGVSPAVSGQGGFSAYAIGLRGATGETWLGGRKAGAPVEGAVLLSLNGGSTWAQVGLGTFTSIVSSIVLDPLAAQGNALVGTRGQGLFVTADGGLTWLPSNTGLTNLSVLCATGATQATTVVYCGTLGGGVFQSANGGAAWTAMAALGHTTVLSLAVSANGKTVLAGTRGGGLYHYKTNP